MFSIRGCRSDRKCKYPPSEVFGRGIFYAKCGCFGESCYETLLVFIDYPTGKRIPKDSLDWYGQVVRGGGIPD